MGDVTTLVPSPIDAARPWKRTAGKWVRGLLMLASLGYLLRTGIVNFPIIREASRQLVVANSALIAGALMLEAAWTYSLSNVYRRALIAQGGWMSPRHALHVSMGAFSLSRILPGGGAAGSIFAAREMVRLGNDVSTTVTSMVLSWWMSMTTLAGLVTVGSSLGVLAGAVPPAYLVGPALALAGLLALGGAMLLARVNTSLRARLTSRVDRLAGRFGLVSSRRNWDLVVRRGGGVRVAGWALANWLSDAAALWLVFAAFGELLHPGVLFVGYGLANLINALPELTPGWLGVMESALAAAYAALGVSAGVAIMAVLAYRLVSYWLPVGVGLIPGLKMLRAAPGLQTAYPQRIAA
jgi:uncharacterized membrane protein YbhN (UPF0104 family)